MHIGCDAWFWERNCWYCHTLTILWSLWTRCSSNLNTSLGWGFICHPTTLEFHTIAKLNLKMFMFMGYFSTYNNQYLCYTMYIASIMIIIWDIMLKYKDVFVIPKQTTDYELTCMGLTWSNVLASLYLCYRLPALGTSPPSPFPCCWLTVCQRWVCFLTCRVYDLCMYWAMTKI